MSVGLTLWRGARLDGFDQLDGLLCLVAQDVRLLRDAAGGGAGEFGCVGSLSTLA